MFNKKKSIIFFFLNASLFGKVLGFAEISERARLLEICSLLCQMRVIFLPRSTQPTCHPTYLTENRELCQILESSGTMKRRG